MLTDKQYLYTEQQANIIAGDFLEQKFTSKEEAEAVLKELKKRLEIELDESIIEELEL